MTGPEAAHANPGGFDLLRRATQAMMSRTAATDDDGASDIGFETPRSGIATPQPSLQDNRLPQIASYFGQVGADAPVKETSSFVKTPSTVDMTQQDMAGRGEDLRVHKAEGQTTTSATEAMADLSLKAQNPDNKPQASHLKPLPSHPYPTPPASQSSSSRNSEQGEICSGVARPVRSNSSGGRDNPVRAWLPTGASVPPKSLTQISYSFSHSTTSSLPDPPSSASQALESGVGEDTSQSNTNPNRSSWFSLGGLKELTRGVVFKSGPSTPTRALSHARPSSNDGKDTPSRTSHDGHHASGTATPRLPHGAQAPTAKGKLTIKIKEGKGIRKSRDPYAVVVFQRNELISGGPHPEEEDEDPTTTPTSLGAIPMARQISESNRPPMAIPMRSRQSSNTSITDYSSFRNRPAMRGFYTNPKWDAEALFDVVDSDMLVDVSIYDHTPTGEVFLGHVDFEAAADIGGHVSGWYALRGHADTMAENAPTGQILVEASFHRSEKKHFGPSDFEILKLIGKGTFGQVYQVRKKDTKRIYAMKVLQKKVIVQKKEVAHTVGERNILVRTAMSDSPFIVGLKFSFQTPSELYLVTDYMSGGELFWHLQKEGRFDEKRAKFYIAELILAIQHLHKSDIVYRDLKPENILLDANGHIALCDFGLSKANLTQNDTTNTFCGTTEYLAPEVLLDESGYTKMVDFWSLGVLVFEMCCGWSPFYAEDTQQMYKNIAFGKVRFPRETLSQDGRNLVKGLLNRNPRHRLGATDDAEELKRQPFFNDIDWDLLAKKLITPPFKPKLKSETDVSYFDPEFTTALDQNGSLNERAAALARGYAASTPLSPSVQANFQGFTYVDESALEDHMRDRMRPDDEDMDDVHNSHDEDEWDNLDDIDLRRTNRMSGIVRTSQDENMVGNSNFEM